jgi:type VI protein secretion system component Hcp
VSKQDRAFRRLDDGSDVAGANRREVLLGAGGLAAVAAVARSAGDAHVKPHTTMMMTIEGIGAFNVLAYSWGASNSVTIGTGGGGGGAGKMNVQDLSFTKHTDVSTPKLFLALAEGKHLTKAKLTVSSRRPSTVTVFDLEELFLSSLSMGASDTADTQTENVTVAFRRIKLTVNDVPAGWDVVLNRKI